MSIADDIAGPSKPGPRVVCLDLERLIGKVELDMWGPRDFKHVNYVHPDRWKRLPSNLSVAWRVLGERKTHFAATWDSDDPHYLAKVTWALYDGADYVLGYNQKRADNLWCKQSWGESGLTRPRPWKDIDLYQVMGQIGFESRSLAHSAKRLEVKRKSGHYNAKEAEAAANGDTAAQKRLARYNKGDITATIALFERVRELVHIPGLNLGLGYGDDKLRCAYCGHDRLTDAGTWASTGQTQYGMYECARCHNFTRNASRRHAVTYRGVV